MNELTPVASADTRTQDKGGFRTSATTFLGLVGLIFTAAQVWMLHAKDDFDKKSKEFDVIVSLFQKCASDSASDQAFANRFIGVQAKTSIANYNNYFADDTTFKQALADCSALVANNAASTPPPPSSIVTPPEALPESASIGGSERSSRGRGPDTPSAPPNDGPRFWIYLGTRGNGGWTSKYLDIPDTFDPAAFQRSSDPMKGIYRVIASKPLNVRYGTFSATGDFPPPTNVLKPGQVVELRSTAQWFDSGNWWATIAPVSH